VEHSSPWVADKYSVKNSPLFMEPDESLPYAEELATGQCPDLIEFRPHLVFVRSVLIITFRLCLGLPFGLFPSSFLTKIL
jgi:hypothetical protein